MEQSGINSPRVTGERDKLWYVTLVAFVACSGAFVFGYDLMIITGALLYVEEYFSLDAAGLGFAMASAIIGCVFGPFLGLWTCDQFGRKKVLIFTSIILAISAIGTALPNDIVTFNIFRIVGGVGVGLASIASPMYIAEIAPAKFRGRLGLMYQIAFVLGATLSGLVAYGLAACLGDASWRWMFASELVPILAFFVLLMFVPNSPRWLAIRGRDEEALGVLRRLRIEEQARREMAEIQASLSEETGSFRELMQPGVRKALGIAVLLAFFSIWTGWTGVAFYLPKLFQAVGWEDKADAILQTALMRFGAIVLCLLSIWLVDRVGRRPLWNNTALAMTFAMLFGGIVFHFNVTGLPVLIVIIVCMIPHELALGPLPWLMMSELQPTRVRTKAVAISTTVLWIASFTGIFLFPWLGSISESLFGSIAGIFWLYSLISFAAFIFGVRMLPETKGKTLEEIAHFWLHQDSAKNKK